MFVHTKNKYKLTTSHHPTGQTNFNQDTLNQKISMKTRAESPWLDGKHVVFGKVISGMDVVYAIEQVGSDSGRTRVPVMISDSGQLR